MKHTLSMIEEGWQGNGGNYRSGKIISYSVAGMPSGESAKIDWSMGDEGDEWRVYRTKGTATSGWTGHFKSPQDALKWLQQTVDTEQSTGQANPLPCPVCKGGKLVDAIVSGAESDYVPVRCNQCAFTGRRVNLTVVRD